MQQIQESKWSKLQQYGLFSSYYRSWLPDFDSNIQSKLKDLAFIGPHVPGLCGWGEMAQFLTSSQRLVRVRRAEGIN